MSPGLALMRAPLMVGEDSGTDKVRALAKVAKKTKDITTVTNNLKGKQALLLAKALKIFLNTLNPFKQEN